MLFRLVYFSRANPLQSEAVFDLLQHARENNRELGITGMLLYGQEIFLQALEGERATVNALYRAIVKDDRHRDVTLISGRAIINREFTAWDMGSIGWPDELDSQTRSILLHTLGRETMEPETLVGQEVVALFRALVTQGYLAPDA